MRRSERNALRALYQFRCAYCGTTEVDAGGELTVDHFQPHARGGADAPDNWVYACIICNDYKGDYWQPDSVRRILHPLHDHFAEHISEGANVSN
jgi:5-methylcytosine-specific restriction endonuclease McrA